MKAVMIECLDICNPSIKQLGEIASLPIKKGIAVVGGTGAGKSTFINYLNGCTMERTNFDGKKVITVKPKSKGGAADSITPIGHGKKSMTFIPTYSLSSHGIFFIDCPGLFDTRGSAINIGNAVNTKRILEEMDELSIVILIDGTSIKGARGRLIKQVIDAMSKFFGSK